MVIVEMVKEFTDEEAFVAHPDKVELWFDMVNLDLIR
jgi:hypothetical protein